MRCVTDVFHWYWMTHILKSYISLCMTEDLGYDRIDQTEDWFPTSSLQIFPHLKFKRLNPETWIPVKPFFHSHWQMSFHRDVYFYLLLQQSRIVLRPNATRYTQR